MIQFLHIYIYLSLELLSYLKQMLKSPDVDIFSFQSKKTTIHDLDQHIHKNKSYRSANYMNQENKTNFGSLIKSPQKASSMSTLSQYCTFQHPFVLIEDISGIYKPIFKEFKPIKPSKISLVPTLYLDAPKLACPFIKPSTKKNSKEETNIQLVQVNDENSNQFIFNQNQNTQFCQNANIVSQKQISIPIKWVKMKHPGYCECCLEKYSDMDEVCDSIHEF